MMLILFTLLLASGEDSESVLGPLSQITLAGV